MEGNQTPESNPTDSLARVMTGLPRDEKGKESNLLDKVTEIKRPPKPKSFYYSIGLDSLSVASALGFGFSYALFLKTGALTPFLGSALALFMCASLEIFLIKNFWRRMLIFALQAIAIASFFVQTGFWPIFAAAVTFMIFSLWGEISSQAEIRNNLEVRFFKTAKPRFGKIVDALALVMILFYFPTWSINSGFISKETFKAVFDSSSGLMRSISPDITFTSTVADFSESVARYQVKDNSAFLNLSAPARQAAIKQIGEQITERIGLFAGTKISGSETVSGALYGIILKTLMEWWAKLGNWYVFAWMIAAFLLLRSIGSLFSWFAAPLSFVAYQLLLGLNIVQVRGEEAIRETAEFSK